jgi:hypothetical protein
LYEDRSDANRLDQKEVVTLEELTLSNVCDLEGLVEVLTAKGIITKTEVLDMLTELLPPQSRRCCTLQ